MNSRLFSFSSRSPLFVNLITLLKYHSVLKGLVQIQEEQGIFIHSIGVSVPTVTEIGGHTLDGLEVICSYSQQEETNLKFCQL